MKILMTGASGLIGREIGKSLALAGHQIFVISRDAGKNGSRLPFPAEIIEGDLNQGLIQNPLLLQAEGLIHLAGENIGKGRWNEKRKKAISQSRVEFSENLFRSLQASKNLKVIISASAVGYYGPHQDELLNESSSPGADFLANVCREWERAVEQGAQGVESQPRWVCLRTGVVLSPQGGALEKMILPFRWGLGAVLGNGKQWMSWIHLADIRRLYIEALMNESYQGVYNAVAPDPVRHHEFMTTLARVLQKTLRPAVPAFVIKSLLGEMATLVLDGQKVSGQKILDRGFQPIFKTVEQALEDVCQPRAFQDDPRSPERR